MGYGLRKKPREIIVLWCINWRGWGGGGAALLNMGLRGMMVCYFVENLNAFGCSNGNNLLIYQDLFFIKVYFYDNLNNFKYRPCSVHVI